MSIYDTRNNVKGLYVHIPFCLNICSYCDFGKCRYEKSLADNYLIHLEKEINLIKQEQFESIYIGGGTPTALNYQQLEKLLSILSRFKVVKEYTIEINPESFDYQKACLIKKYGINRVSIGVQSFNEGLLQHMGRTHKNSDVENTLHYLREVDIKNRSIDLMFGFNKQNMSMLLTDLETAVNKDITHISIYDLEIYPKTKFGINNYQKIDDQLDYLMYQTIIDYLNEHSYKQYEISNFALGHYQSNHNKLYWHYEDFYGVGLSASGKIGNIRYTNTGNFIEYLKDNYCQEEITLSLEDQYFEAVMMNLRLLEGINIKQYNQRFEIDLLEHYKQAIGKNIKSGLLEIADGYLKATPKGLMVLNDILVDFIQQ